MSDGHHDQFLTLLAAKHMLFLDSVLELRRHEMLAIPTGQQAIVYTNLKQLLIGKEVDIEPFAMWAGH